MFLSCRSLCHTLMSCSARTAWIRLTAVLRRAGSSVAQPESSRRLVSSQSCNGLMYS